MGWPVQVVDVTGSTNADLAAAARAGERGPLVLAARSQTSGRGRLGRQWQSPPGSSLSVSVLWCPAVPQAVWPWLPMVVGLAVVDGLERLGAGAALKWPNDVVVPRPGATRGDEPGSEPEPKGALEGLAKVAGVLVEGVAGPAGAAVVAGVGLNLSPEAAADVPGATSVHEVTGGPVVFERALAELVEALGRRLPTWERADGDPVASGVHDGYVRACTTLGRHVRVRTPGGVREGRAVEIGVDGALVLAGGDGPVRVSAGDVEHVR
jgi:BirA family transcriptional regulator, biotin operon repressor / biotin---[acetyl-CoA-carboxylase] ligase